MTRKKAAPPSGGQAGETAPINQQYLNPVPANGQVPLAAMVALPQWILADDQKKPINPHTGKPYPKGSNWLADPQMWSSYEGATAVAQRLGYRTGFVLTRNDDLFVIDLDNCLLDNPPRWSPEALTLISLLPGAAVEVSQSGRGLHLIGTAKNIPPHSCKNTNLRVELYQDNRFFLITGDRAMGDAATDCTAALSAVIAEYFPPAERTVDQAWTTEPRPGYPAGLTDDELLTKALACTSTASLFQGKATFRDLWTGNVEALARQYPTNDERPYDYSSADAALAQHLAFWTGCDCERMLRLMWRSALARDKWDRPDYLRRTILRAVAGQEQVYSVGGDPGAISVSCNLEDPETFDLNSFSLNGKSRAMEQQMLEDRYVLGQMALVGQSSIFYAKPNAGKTLLITWLICEKIKSGELNGADVFYINADDTHKGLVFKLKLAEKYGFQMLAPGYENFKADHLSKYLEKLIGGDKARGKVLILDTSKKFTDPMSKDKSSQFGNITRQFISHGGTVVSLAHVNKHRDDNKKVIFAGTSDLVDDCDCAYTLDIVNDNAATGIRTVVFENFKSRGDSVREAFYTYNFADGTPYHERLNSVVAVGEDERKAAEKAKRLATLLERNQPAIEIIRGCIVEGINQKTLLIKESAERSGLSKKRIIQVLQDHIGSNLAENQFWQMDVRENNSHVFLLN